MCLPGTDGFLYLPVFCLSMSFAPSQSMMCLPVVTWYVRTDSLKSDINLPRAPCVFLIVRVVYILPVFVQSCFQQSPGFSKVDKSSKTESYQAGKNSHKRTTSSPGPKGALRFALRHPHQTPHTRRRQQPTRLDLRTTNSCG